MEATLPMRIWRYKGCPPLFMPFDHRSKVVCVASVYEWASLSNSDCKHEIFDMSHYAIFLTVCNLCIAELARPLGQLKWWLSLSFYLPPRLLLPLLGLDKEGGPEKKWKCTGEYWVWTFGVSKGLPKASREPLSPDPGSTARKFKKFPFHSPTGTWSWGSCHCTNSSPAKT